MRQRETEHERGRVRERETQNLKQAPGSERSAQSPTRGSTHGPRDHDLSRSQQLNRLSHPGTPQVLLLRPNYIKVGVQEASLSGGRPSVPIHPPPGPCHQAGWIARLPAVMHLQTKNCQGLLGTLEAKRKAGNRLSPRDL